MEPALQALPDRKRGNVVVELSGRRAAGGALEDQFEIAADVPSVAIERSTPATAPARAVVVMIDADPAHDRRPTNWTGAFVVDHP